MSETIGICIYPAGELAGVDLTSEMGGTMRATDHQRDNSQTPTKLNINRLDCQCMREREMCVSLSSLPGCFVPLFGQTELWITVRKVKQKLSMRGGKGREATGCSGQLWSVRSSPHHH